MKCVQTWLLAGEGWIGACTSGVRGKLCFQRQQGFLVAQCCRWLPRVPWERRALTIMWEGYEDTWQQGYGKPQGNIISPHCTHAHVHVLLHRHSLGAVKERLHVHSCGRGCPVTVTRCPPSWNLVEVLRNLLPACQRDDCSPWQSSSPTNRAVRVNPEVNDFSLVDIHHWLKFRYSNSLVRLRGKTTRYTVKQEKLFANSSDITGRLWRNLARLWRTVVHFCISACRPH